MRGIFSIAAALAVAALFGSPNARALEIVTVDDAPSIRLTDALERREQGVGEGWINVSTAPSPDGIIGRMSVRTRADGARSHWALVAPANKSDQRIERLLVASCDDQPGRFNVLSQLFCGSQVLAVVPSRGPAARRIQAASGDVFSLGLDPQSVTTLVIELTADRTPTLYLWESEAYRRQDNTPLQRRIVIGGAVLLTAMLALLSWLIRRRRRSA